MSTALAEAERHRQSGGRTVQRLGGHSGAEVALCVGAQDRSFVRKTAAARAGNLRLRRQALKQRLFAAQGLAFPPIYDIGLDSGGLAYFDMAYLPARTLAETILHASPYDRAAVRAAIAGLLSLFGASAGAAIAPHLFRAKIGDIVEQSRRRPRLFPHAAAIAALAARLADADWSGIPQSPDHGDLTLENILLTQDGGIVFIDCDVPWVSSFWLDLAKLLQDLEGRWFLRDVAAPSVDALERMTRLADDIRGVAEEMDSRLPPRLGQMAALHLFRTLPYVREGAHAAFACAAASRLLAESGS
ncbi:MAG: phosphotransferase [Rhizomicrobium sp.]